MTRRKGTCRERVGVSGTGGGGRFPVPHAPQQRTQNPQGAWAQCSHCAGAPGGTGAAETRRRLELHPARSHCAAPSKASSGGGPPLRASWELNVCPQIRTRKPSHQRDGLAGGAFGRRSVQPSPRDGALRKGRRAGWPPHLSHTCSMGEGSCQRQSVLAPQSGTSSFQTGAKVF